MDNDKIDLNECREKINDIDENMAYEFEERMRIVGKIAKYKMQNNLSTYDPQRESIIKNRNKCYISPELQKYYVQFFDEILYLSKQYQNDRRKAESNLSNKEELEK